MSRDEKVKEILENYGMNMAKEAIEQIKNGKVNTQYKQFRDQALAQLNEVYKIEEGEIIKEINKHYNLMADTYTDFTEHLIYKNHIENLAHQIAQRLQEG